MQVCEKCKVSVVGNRTRCPLCQGVLVGEGNEQEERFPMPPPIDQRYHLFIRLILFVSVAAAVVCMAINYLMPAGGWWSLFVAAGIGCMWVSLIIAVQKKNNFSKNIMWQVATLSILAFLWDRFTGWHGWSLDYVIPGLCAVAMAAMAVIAKLKRLRLADFIIYLVINALFGILPLVFLLLDWTHVAAPSMICVVVSVLSLAALFLFEGDNMRAEIRRRLHL